MSMFTEAPFMSMMMIGLPASVISIVCYCLCCLANETSMNDPDLSYEMIKNNQLTESIEDDDDDDDDEQSQSTMTTNDEQKSMTEKKDD